MDVNPVSSEKLHDFKIICPAMGLGAHLYTFLDMGLMRSKNVHWMVMFPKRDFPQALPFLSSMNGQSPNI